MSAPDAGPPAPAAPARDLRSSRFYAILDTAYVPRDRWIEVCAQLIAGGADLVQVRAKRESPPERERLLRDVLPLFAPQTGAAPYLIINDDVALCACVPGVGLHVGQDDTPADDARRRIGPDRILGLSTHSAAQAQRAAALAPGVLDYFCIGPVFTTQTKPDYAPVGLTLVTHVAQARPALPWFAIGGINRTNVTLVRDAGAERVVVVSDVLCDRDPARAIREIRAHFSKA